MNALSPIPKTHNNPAGGGAQPPRLSPKLRKSIEHIAIYGSTQRDAAKAAGMDESALGRALKRPHVAAELDRLKSMAYEEAANLKHLAKGVAIRVGMDLMLNSKSDAVRARMVEFFAGEAKGPAVQVQVNTGAPAYIYERPTDQPSSANPTQPIEIEGKATEV